MYLISGWILKVEGLSNVKYVSLGHSHSAAVTESGDLYTWGNNDNGQLGDGTRISRYVPQKVSGISNVKYISLAADRSAAVTENGDVYIWGSWIGYTRDNDPADILTPALVHLRRTEDASNRMFAVLEDNRSDQADSGDNEYDSYHYYEYALLDESVKNAKSINKAIVEQKDSFFALEDPKSATEEHPAEYDVVYAHDIASESAVDLKDVYLDEQYFSLNLQHTDLFGSGMTKYVGHTYDLNTGAVVTLPDILGMTLDETKDFVWKRLKYHITVRNYTDTVLYDNAELSVRGKAADEFSFCIKANGAIYLLCSKYEYESGSAGAKEVFLTFLNDGKEKIGGYSNDLDLFDKIWGDKA